MKTGLRMAASNYRLKSPARLVGSVGTLYKLGPIQGFINADLEWVDYNNNRFDFTSHSTDPAEEQNTIDINDEVEKIPGLRGQPEIGN
jgi:hypothetical protein